MTGIDTLTAALVLFSVCFLAAVIPISALTIMFLAFVGRAVRRQEVRRRA